MLREPVRPFTSRQITTIVVAVCAAAVLTPSAAIAAGSLMTIADPSTSAKARVTSTGALKTESAESIEARSWANFGRIIDLDVGAVDRVVLVGPTTKTAALSSLTLSSLSADMAEMTGVGVRAVEPTGTSCAGSSDYTLRDDLIRLAVRRHETHTTTFPDAIVARPRAGKTVCIIALLDKTWINAPGYDVTVSASGFTR